MREIVQIEHRQSLLSTREDLLCVLGHPIVSVLGFDVARTIDFGSHEVGVIVIGHGAPWHERVDLVSHFKSTLPSVAVVALLGRRDERLRGADYNCPADNPPMWLRTVIQALNLELQACASAGRC